jgi:hypothetical protein
MKKAVSLAVLLLALVPLRSLTQEQGWSQVKTYSILPGKTLNIRNKNFHIVEIRTEYPVQIAAGECQNDYTVQWTCKFDDPADLFIRDLRAPPVFATPKANSITVSAK